MTRDKVALVWMRRTKELALLVFEKVHAFPRSFASFPAAVVLIAIFVGVAPQAITLIVLPLTLKYGTVRVVHFSRAIFFILAVASTIGCAILECVSSPPFALPMHVRAGVGVTVRVISNTLAVPAAVIIAPTLIRQGTVVTHRAASRTPAASS